MELHIRGVSKTFQRRVGAEGHDAHDTFGDVRPARPERRRQADPDAYSGHAIYALERPLQPRDALRLDFEVWYRPYEFRESGAHDSVVANGTFFTGGWLPVIGYQRRRELTSASDRRERELAPRPLIPSLYDVEARKGWSAIRL